MQANEHISARAATFGNKAVDLAEGFEPHGIKPHPPRAGPGVGVDKVGGGDEVCVVGGGCESMGLRLNDLHPHPLSILNFKFVIRKHFG